MDDPSLDSFDGCDTPHLPHTALYQLYPSRHCSARKHVRRVYQKPSGFPTLLIFKTALTGGVPAGGSIFTSDPLYNADFHPRFHGLPCLHLLIIHHHHHRHLPLKVSRCNNSNNDRRLPPFPSSPCILGSICTAEEIPKIYPVLPAPPHRSTPFHSYTSHTPVKHSARTTPTRTSAPIQPRRVVCFGTLISLDSLPVAVHCDSPATPDVRPAVGRLAARPSAHGNPCGLRTGRPHRNHWKDGLRCPISEVLCSAVLFILPLTSSLSHIFRASSLIPSSVFKSTIHSSFLMFRTFTFPSHPHIPSHSHFAQGLNLIHLLAFLHFVGSVSIYLLPIRMHS